MKSNYYSLTLAVLALIAGCGGGSQQQQAPPQSKIVSVTITCATKPCSVQTEKTLQLSAAVVATGAYSTTVNWFVDGVVLGNSTDGTIDNTGLYTAPNAVPSGGTVTVKALGADGETSGSTTVTVTQAPVPVLVAYVDTIYSRPACGNQPCINIYTFDLSMPATKTQITPDSLFQYLSPAISPDQSETAYVFQPNGSATAPYQSAVYTVPTQQSGTTPTLVKGWDATYTVWDVDWKPDGSAFVISYWDHTAGIAGLATMSKDGSVITPLAKTSVVCAGNSCYHPPSGPRYLPDGRIVYAVAEPQLNDQVFILSADGKTLTNLSNNSVEDGWPFPSPDGTQIVYIHDLLGSSELYTMHADGSGADPLVTTPSNFPAWCQGNKIVFVDTADGNLYSVNSADASGKTKLTTNPSGAAIEPYCR